MAEAFICEAVRTPVGKKKGTLSATVPTDLAAHVLKAVVDRVGVDPAEIEDVVMGCVTQHEEQGWNIARMATLAAGYPVEVPAASVNRMCASSLQSANFAAQAIMSGQMDVAIGAGVESMSRVRMGSDGGQVSDLVTANYNVIPQGLSAEMIAGQWELSREDLDQYSYDSHMRALAAQEAGAFDNEIVPMTVTNPDGDEVTLSADETPRAGTTLEKMASLPPAFNPDGGVVTAANSSQICDGASALLLASGDAVERLGLKPRARIVSTGLSGVDPMIMLTGNPEAMKRALKRASLSLDDMSVIEVNEAFASVALQTMKDLDLMDRRDDVNPLGGGISIGHPLGASGGRILATMLNELERREGQYALASMCIGFGMACSTLIERVD